MPTQISDVVVPSEFSEYVVEQSMVSTALFQSGVLVPNNLIQSQLAAGSTNFTIPFWGDLGENDPDITNDNPVAFSTPLKLSAHSQIVRKSFLHQSWSEMNLASELAGSDALVRIQSRVMDYWNRTQERRLIASLLGVLYSNVANNAGDMVTNISLTGGGSPTVVNLINGGAVINTALTLGDRLNDMKMIAMHSHVYAYALINDEITFFKPSDNSLDIPTYKGMGIIVDDSLITATAGVYVTILFGLGAVGFGTSQPNTGYGTEIWRVPSAGNGGGLTELHSRINSSIHPLGMSFSGGSVAGESPATAELALAANWNRAVTSRKSIPLAFLISN